MGIRRLALKPNRRNALTAAEAEEEAEHFGVVGVGLGHGKGEVEGQRGGAQRGNVDPHAEARVPRG